MGVFSSCGSKKMITNTSNTTNHRNKPVNLKEKYANILDVKKKALGNEKLYRFIDNWMGVPHKIGGIDKSGIDCSAFTTLLAKEVYNQQLPRIASQMARTVKRKRAEKLREGDLVFFDFEGQKFSHVGVYLQNNKFVHASTSKGVTISNLKDPWYYKYFSRAGKVSQ